MKSIAAVLAALVFLAVASPAARAEEPFHRRLDSSLVTQGVSSLQISGLNGNVRLTADDGTSIRIHADLSARTQQALNAIRVATTRSGRTIRVQSICGTRQVFFWTLSDCDVDLDVHYPRNLAIDLHNDNGNVDVAGARGPVKIAISNGNVTIGDDLNDLDVSAANGNLVVTLAHGWRGRTIALRTRAGNVDLSVPAGFAAVLDAHTHLGNVTDSAHVRSGAARVTANTTLGNVTIKRI